MDFKINPEYAGMFRKPSEEELSEMENSMRTSGQMYPILVNKKGEILDGHTRYGLCKKIGITPKYEVKNFATPDEERVFVIDSNVKRRHLSQYDKILLAIELDNIYNGKKDQIEIANIVGLSPRSLRRGLRVNRIAPDIVKQWLKNGEITLHTADTFITSDRKINTINTLVEQGDLETLEKIKNGKTTLVYAATVLTRMEDSSKPSKIPEDEFDVIYADPPWEYNLPLRGSPIEHYNVLQVDGICTILKDFKINKNAVLFLWATSPKLPEAIRVMREWGFNYITQMVWVKDRIGTGYWFRGQHEILLVGTKGDFPPPADPKKIFPSVLNAPRTEHSAKPKEVYDMIESMCPNRRYLELFSRNKRKGWVMWGNDISNFI